MKANAILCAALFTALSAHASPDLSSADARGVSMLFDDQHTAGSVLVSSVGMPAIAAGIREGDTITEVCTPPASIDHYSLLQAIAKQHGRAVIRWAPFGRQEAQVLPAAKASPEGSMITLDGRRIAAVCVPVARTYELLSAAAPLDSLMVLGKKVAAPRVPVEFHLVRAGKPFIAAVAIEAH